MIKIYISSILLLISCSVFSQTKTESVSSEINKPTQLLNEESQVKKDSTIMEMSSEINSSPIITSAKVSKKEKGIEQSQQSAIEERRKNK
jgi:hypothetical protein